MNSVLSTIKCMERFGNKASHTMLKSEHILCFCVYSE